MSRSLRSRTRTALVSLMAVAGLLTGGVFAMGVTSPATAAAGSATTASAKTASDKAATDKPVSSATVPAKKTATKKAAATKAPSVDCSKAKCVALTFDDGPGPYTARLLDILKKENAKATFFVLGKQAAANPTLVKREANEGHQVANHTWSHAQLTKLSSSSIQSEIARTDAVIAKLTGKKPTFVRPPYGARNSTVDRAIGRPLALWNVDTLDWKTRSASATIASVQRSTKQGSIILMHDIHSSTVDAVPTVVRNLKRQGYQLVTVDDLLKSKHPRAGVSYFSG